MPKGSLGSMSIDARLKLRDEVGKVLTKKANELKHQLARLEGETGNRGRHSSLKGRRQISRWVSQCLGRKRSTASLAERETEGWREA